MTRIEAECNREWKATGWDEYDQHGDDYGLWHEAWVCACRWMREEAAKLADRHDALTNVNHRLAARNIAIDIRRLGEEES